MMPTNTNISLRSSCRSMAVAVFAILVTTILFGCKSKVSDSEMVEISGVVYNNQSPTPLSQAIITNKNTNSQKVEKPWQYGKNLDKGIYRIAKTFWIGEYANREDTAYVEFELQ